MKKRGLFSSKTAQVATEYLVIIGLVMVILAPTVYFLVTYKGASIDAIKLSKLESAANEIIKSANNLYNYGSESKTSVEISIPEGVQSINFEENEIVFNYLNSANVVNELAKVSDANLVGLPIENPVPGTLKLNLINLNLQVCVTTGDEEDCPFCPGVLICNDPYMCGDGEYGIEIDNVCPNEYFPSVYHGEICSATEGENCYDPDCWCERGTGENGCNGGTCVEGNCGSCEIIGGHWCSNNEDPYNSGNQCCTIGGCNGSPLTCQEGGGGGGG